MARNREILSDSEYFRNVVDIVEYAKDCKVNLTNFSGDNFVAWNGTSDGVNYYQMNISNPAQKNISRITALSHECGHILGESLFTPVKDMIAKWTEDPFLKNVYWSCFNVIEDQRIEAFVADIWRANESRFISTRRKLGKGMRIDDTNQPDGILLRQRFYRDDLVTSEYADVYSYALCNVVGTGKFGTVKMLKYLKPYIEEWYKNRNVEKKGQPRPDIPDINSSSSSPLSDIDDEMIKDINKNEELTKEIELEASLKEDRSEYNDVMDNIAETIAEKANSEKPQLNRKFTMIRRGKDTVTVNPKIETGIRKFLTKIHELKTVKHSHDGYEVDVEQYIDNKVNGKDRTEVMLTDKIDKGVSIVISIDGSGSMVNFDNNMEKARNFVASLFKGLSNQKGIELRANVWGSNSMGDVGITEIKSYEDCKYITFKAGYGLTPTHLALEYSSMQLNKMKGRKKLLIMLTDGKPEYRSKKYKLSDMQMVSMTKKSLLKVRRNNPHVMCIMLTSRRILRYSPRVLMNKIFGKSRYFEFSDMNGAEEKIIKEFRKLVIRNTR